MLFDQDRLDAIIHNWKNQVFSNKTIHGVPRSAFDVFEAAYRRVTEPRVEGYIKHLEHGHRFRLGMGVSITVDISAKKAYRDKQWVLHDNGHFLTNNTYFSLEMVGKMAINEIPNCWIWPSKLCIELTLSKACTFDFLKPVLDHISI